MDASKAAIFLWSSLHGLLQMREMEDVLFAACDFVELFRFNLERLIAALQAR